MTFANKKGRTAGTERPQNSHQEKSVVKPFLEES